MSYNEGMSNSLTAESKSTKHDSKYDYNWVSLTNYVLVSMCYCLGPEALLIFNENDTELEIPLLVVIILFLGLPMLYMEVSLGKYTQNGAIHLQYMIPIARGIAYMLLLNVGISIIKCVHYLHDTVLYFLLSFQAVLPWTECPANTKTFCYYNRTQFENCTRRRPDCQHTAKLFWKHIYMDNPEPNSKPVLQRFVCLWLCLLIIFAAVVIAFRKRYSLYIVLAIQFIVCLFFMVTTVLLSHGSSIGVTTMFTVHAEHYLNISMWARSVTKSTKILALGQTFHVLGGKRMVASTLADVWCIVFVIVFILIASVYCLFVYGLLGIGSHQSGLPFGNIVVTSTYEVVFIHAPGYLSYLSGAQFWCIIFFWSASCLLMLNIMTRLMSILHNITNHVSYMMKYRIYLVALCCVIAGIVGSFTLPGTSVQSSKLFFNEIFDLTELLAATLLSIIVFWIYSVRTLGDDIYFISGQQPSKFWKISWYIAPLIYIATTVYNVYECTEHAKEHTGFKIGVIVVVVFPVFVFAMIQFFIYLKKRRLIGLLQPEAEWGVPDPEERHMRRLFNPRKEVRSKIRRYKCQHKCLLNNKVLHLACQQEALQRKELFEQ